VKCRECAEFIADYLSGELEPETTALFEHHLSRCVNCTTYLSNYRDTIRLGRQAFDEAGAEAPDDVPEDLVKAILASRRSAS
jgi:anti-sigma factor RsiW